MKKTAFFIIFLALVSSCTQKVSNPEYQDEIYKDLVVELDIAKKSLEEEEKNLVSLEQEKKRAVPQTGQIKFTNKKISDSLDRIQTLKQQKLYFEIRLESRAQYARERYAESLKEGGRPWPDLEEVAAYRAVAQFQRNKLEYERTKKLKSSSSSVPRGTNEKDKQKK